MAIDIDKKIKLNKEFYGEKTAIIAQSGGGKSYTARVIIEEGLASGHTFVIFDPQEAYMNLPQMEYIQAQNVKSVAGLGKIIAQTHRNTVILLKSLTIEKQQGFVNDFLKSYKKNVSKGIQTLVIDEFHKFAPESEKTACKSEVRGLFQESRSDGIGIFLISQRPQRVDKTCLSQCTNYFIGRLTSQRDQQAVNNYIDRTKMTKELRDFESGEFYIDGIKRDPEIVKIREAKTVHSGNSPKKIY